MNNPRTLFVSRWLLAASALLAGAPAVAAAPAAPGGLYVGYYQEDPATNPEDPTPGAFVLNLPENDATFDGAMFFTFVGCQSSNVGAVKGSKAGYALSGTWSGNIDNSAQSGPYQGSYDPATGYYKGVYSNSAGKQFKDIPGCIKYYIGPNGSWEMFAVERNQPAGFKVDISASKVSWAKVPGAAMALVYLLDTAAAKPGGGNPIKFQTVVPPQVTSFNIPAGALGKGKEYVVATLITDARAKRLAFASKRFTAP
nr:hypothetical protein [uncultured Duganella sp.]